MSIANPYAAYRAAQTTTSSQLQLIVALHDGAMRNLAKAANALAKKDYPAKAEAFGKALKIINHLWSSLDKNNGGEVAENLDAIYAYMHKRLVQANLRDDFGPIKEAIVHLRELRESWAQLDMQMKSQRQSPLKQPQAESNDQLQLAA
jgi:flagellar protein FliS